jgi:hypothetical protein
VKESELKSRLARYRQIKISVIGRKSGRTISIPVWFVLGGEKLYLLPVQAPTRSGTGMCSGTHRSGLMRGERRRNSEPFPPLMPRP